MMTREDAEKITLEVEDAWLVKPESAAQPAPERVDASDESPEQIVQGLEDAWQVKDAAPARRADSARQVTRTDGGLIDDE